MDGQDAPGLPRRVQHGRPPPGLEEVLHDALQLGRQPLGLRDGRLGVVGEAAGRAEEHVGRDARRKVGLDPQLHLPAAGPLLLGHGHVLRPVVDAVGHPDVGRRGYVHYRRQQRPESGQRGQVGGIHAVHDGVEHGPGDRRAGLVQEAHGAVQVVPAVDERRRGQHDDEPGRLGQRHRVPEGLCLHAADVVNLVDNHDGAASDCQLVCRLVAGERVVCRDGAQALHEILLVRGDQAGLGHDDDRLQICRGDQTLADRDRGEGLAHPDAQQQRHRPGAGVPGHGRDGRHLLQRRQLYAVGTDVGWYDVVHLAVFILALGHTIYPCCGGPWV